MDHIPYRTYAEINLQHVKENTATVRSLLRDDCMLLSVLKANGYGHGAIPIAKAIEQQSDWFGVASFEEARELRDHGIMIPILVFGFVDDDDIEEAYRKHITCCVLSYEYAQHVQQLCEQLHITLDMHIKIDTGFHRTGIACRQEDIAQTCVKVAHIYHMNHIHITGIYTHFATAGSADKEDKKFLQLQYSLFHQVLDYLKQAAIQPGIRHCCNAKATLTNPEMHMDMVRVGLYLYGLGSDADIARLQLQPIVQWKARIYDITYVQAQESVGYSRAFIADHAMRIGVVSLGFADGYARCLYCSDHVYVLVHGQRTRILGKICMDVLMIDLTDIADAEVNDYITVLGCDGNDAISANLLGRETGGTAVEITCGMSPRVQRVYRHGEI